MSTEPSASTLGAPPQRVSPPRRAVRSLTDTAACLERMHASGWVAPPVVARRNIKRWFGLRDRAGATSGCNQPAVARAFHHFRNRGPVADISIDSRSNCLYALSQIHFLSIGSLKCDGAFTQVLHCVRYAPQNSLAKERWSRQHWPGDNFGGSKQSL